MDVIKILIVITLFGIVFSLGSALFHMSRNKGGDEEQSRKMARSLTIRVGLSLVLFILLMLAWYNGLIAPHGLVGR
jgi:cytochrome bd-type quinol oxidase subunit 2